ncbi:3-phosphoserine/phosphohydroxythreonine transaminase [Solitalea koreensis]|uniref:Phosphoserine aminotransferase n=1 Tax=Solitalea koreensis TaxID=543615 RepID=A0A521EJZ8_9SPHI|nr:3-phosphoserine/phosphohydroxythreonine transaminase [Solitalea koreensis]SMO84245.1 phosphoserine aminotransferase apoenzyme [Solitalea koreensis]
MKHNFGAGPGILPQQVLQEAAQAVINFNNSGLSILEISHRSPDFEAVMDEARALVKELLNLGDNYSVMFLHGGASSQFAMLPYNLLGENETAAYLDSGTWANKAIKEAKFFGKVNVVASSKESNYTFIPKDYEIPKDARYFHVTSNNTIYGTQIHQFPESPVPLVSDMSSDIFSREFDANKFGLIYAGAQKNMGPAGVALVIVRNDLVGTVERAIPSMFNYKLHIENGSMYNTPPVFAVYVSMLTLRWVKAQGGIKAMEKINNEKAAKLYAEIDRNTLFKGTCAVEDRSRMNVCFVMNSPEQEKEFLNFAKERDCVGLKGHRSVGGFRASIYNALPLSSVEHLVKAMQDFEKIGSSKPELSMK